MFKQTFSSWSIEMPTKTIFTGVKTINFSCKDLEAKTRDAKPGTVQWENLFLCLHNWYKPQWAEGSDWYWMWALPEWQDRVCRLVAAHAPGENVRNTVTEHCHMLCGWAVSSPWQNILQKGPLRKSEARSLSFPSSWDDGSKFQLKAIKEWARLMLQRTTWSFYLTTHYVSYHKRRKTKYEPEREREPQAAVIEPAWPFSQLYCYDHMK